MFTISIILIVFLFIGLSFITGYLGQKNEQNDNTQKPSYTPVSWLKIDYNPPLFGSIYTSIDLPENEQDES